MFYSYFLQLPMLRINSTAIYFNVTNSQKMALDAFEKLKNSEFYEQGVPTFNQPASSENGSGKKSGITSFKSGTVIVNQRQVCKH